MLQESPIQTHAVKSANFVLACIVGLLLMAGDNSARARVTTFSARPVMVLSGHQKRLNSLAFSMDGTLLAAGDVEGKINVWRLGTSRLLRTFRGSSHFPSFTFSPDGSRFVVATDPPSVTVWNLRSGELLSTLGVPDGLAYATAYSPDGKWIVAACSNGAIRIWNDVGQALRTVAGPASSTLAIMNFPDGARVAAAAEGRLQTWSIQTGDAGATRKLDGFFSRFLGGHEVAPLLAMPRLSPDGDVLVAYTSTDIVALNQLIAWDTRTGQRFGEWVTFGRPLFDFSVDGSTLSVSSGMIIAIAESKTLKEIGRINAGHWVSSAAAFSPDGKRIASGHDDGIVRIWNVQPRRHWIKP